MEDIGRIKVFFKDKKKKSYSRIFKETLHLLFLKKEIPFYYFKRIYQKDFKNYTDFLGTKEGARIHKNKVIHKKEYVSILSNKLSFSLYFMNCGIATPKLISYNHSNHFIHEGNLYVVRSEEDVVHFFDTIFNQRPNSKGVFLRPFSLLGGYGCQKLSRDNLKQKLDACHKDLIASNYVHTEVIEQHARLNEVFSHSLNTMRVITFITKDNTIEIITAYMRFGAGTSFVDNGSSGGLYVGIDMVSGTLYETGYQDMYNGNTTLYEHPDTKFRFEGFEVPFFNECIDLAKKAAMYLPNAFVGWDIGITPGGPTLIEGNENPTLEASEIAYGGYLRNPHMRQLIKDLKAGKY